MSRAPKRFAARPWNDPEFWAWHDWHGPTTFPLSPAESAIELLYRHLRDDEYALAKLDTIDAALRAQREDAG